MKIMIPGYRYLFEGDERQVIQFIQKEEKDGEFVTVNDGTTNEEVLAVLIDRLKFLENKLPDIFTTRAIAHLRFALSELNARTLSRSRRGVEGTSKP